MSSPAGKNHGGAGAPGEEEEDLGRLVHGQLLADIEQARDRCKPDLILRRLQQELAAGVVSWQGLGRASSSSFKGVVTSQPARLAHCPGAPTPVACLLPTERLLTKHFSPSSPLPDPRLGSVCWPRRGGGL